ncbi:hypothetical protein [uncultured Aquimarina sp.]|uniref:hypothetical protein n=1 Tax=uncultured Aquimarina sp. TaxID=575652 RepID=UPI0026167F52|nr:hypothetical protein [uncultured Aquimarina sp.]
MKKQSLIQGNYYSQSKVNILKIRFICFFILIGGHSFSQTVFDFNAKAHLALWQTSTIDKNSNALPGTAKIIKYGKNYRENGEVKVRNLILEDGKRYNCLFTHPKWTKNGTVKGWYPKIKKLPENSILTGRIGFAKPQGRAGTDGARFMIFIHYFVNGREQWKPILDRYKKFNGKLQSFHVDLSKYEGQKIFFELRVDTGNTSNQDWAVWNNVKVISTPQSINDKVNMCVAFGESDKKITIVNKKGEQEIDQTTAKLVAISDKLWPVGKTLKVKLDGASPMLKEKIKNIANEWTLYANIKFDFVEHGDPEIYVKFDPEGGYRSLIGNQSVDFLTRIGYDIISRGTMNLAVNDETSDLELRRVVLHEFGHALGFKHEHQNPTAGVPWNIGAVYDYYHSAEGWDRDRTRRNVLKKLDKTETQYSHFDPLSIMIYPIHNDLTIGNFTTTNNYDLSDMDKSFASVLYPFPNVTGNRIRATITTGDDDLREECDVYMIVWYNTNAGLKEFRVSLNRRQRWTNYSTHSKDIPLPGGVGINDVVSITLNFVTRKRNSVPHMWTDEDDTWYVNNIKFEYVNANNDVFPLMNELEGSPYIKFIGKRNPLLLIGLQ